MKPVPIGLRGVGRRRASSEDTADALGHVGVEVVATTRLILWIEQVAHEALLPFLEADEVSVGAHVDVRHLLPTWVGEAVAVEVVAVEASPRKVVFDAVASAGGHVVMRGVHTRGIVPRSSFARPVVVA